jgi:hypothetical protein
MAGEQSSMHLMQIFHHAWAFRRIRAAVACRSQRPATICAAAFS